MKKQFIDKWRCWWVLQKQGVELTDAFQKELDDVITHELALSQPPVSDSMPNDKDEQFAVRVFRNVQMVSKVERILQPTHMNTAFTWKQIKDAIISDNNEQ